VPRRVIRKYGNRRLYDTGESRYVTLDDVARLVRAGHDVQVLDAASGDDLTRLVLTQVILDEARQKRGELPVDFLRQLIVAEGQAVRDFFRWYVETALATAQRAIPPVSLGDLFGRRPPPEPATVEELQRTIAGLKSRLDELERKGPARPRGRKGGKAGPPKGR